MLSSAGALCPYSDTLQHALRRSSDFPINQLRVQVKKEMEQLEKAEIGNPKTPLNKTPYLSDDIVEKLNEGISYAPPQPHPSASNCCGHIRRSR